MAQKCEEKLQVIIVSDVSSCALRSAKIRSEKRQEEETNASINHLQLLCYRCDFSASILSFAHERGSGGKSSPA